MSRLDNARKFRKEFEASKNVGRKLITATSLSAEELAGVIDIYDDWIPSEAVAVGMQRKHEGKLYEVIQAHTTQSDWEPQNTPALWKEIMPQNVIREIPDPITTELQFALGEMGTWKGKIYESLLPANVHTPDAYPTGWKLIQ